MVLQRWCLVSNSGSSTAKAKPKLFNAAPDPVTVGVWNLGDWLGYLPEWLEVMNKHQSRYRFFTIEAMVPLGMVRRPEGVIAWAEQTAHKTLDKTVKAQMKIQTISDEYFKIAEKVRDDVSVPAARGSSKLNFHVGITPAMVALVSADNKPHWNYFSDSSGRLALASTYDLRRYANESGIEFAVFVMGVIVAQVLVAQFCGKGLGFHKENRAAASSIGMATAKASKTRCANPSSNNVAWTSFLRINEPPLKVS